MITVGTTWQHIMSGDDLFLDGIQERDDVFVIDLDTWDYQEAVKELRSFLAGARLAN